MFDLYSVSPDLSIGFDTYLRACSGSERGDHRFCHVTTPSGTLKSNKQFRVGP